MPLYEYRCSNGHDFEQFFRSIGTASSEAECPVCGAIGERRLSAAGLVFKGSGFYITDYGKDGKKAEREAATAEATKSEPAAVSASSKPGSPKPDPALAASPKAGEAGPAREASKSETPKSSPKTSTSA